LQNHFEAPAY